MNKAATALMCTGLMAGSIAAILYGVGSIDRSKFYQTDPPAQSQPSEQSFDSATFMANVDKLNQTIAEAKTSLESENDSPKMYADNGLLRPYEQGNIPSKHTENAKESVIPNSNHIESTSSEIQTTEDAATFKDGNDYQEFESSEDLLKDYLQNSYTAKNPSLTKEELLDLFVEKATPILAEQYQYRSKVSRKDNIVEMCVWREGVTTASLIADSGNKEFMILYERMKAGSEKSAKVYYSVLKQVSPDSHLLFSVLNDINQDRRLLTWLDGECIYDFLEGGGFFSKLDTKIQDSDSLQLLLDFCDEKLKESFGNNYRIEQADNNVFVSVWFEGLVLSTLINRSFNGDTEAYQGLLQSAESAAKIITELSQKVNLISHEVFSLHREKTSWEIKLIT